MMRFILVTFLVFVFGIVTLTPATLIYLYNQAPPVRYSTRKIITPIVSPGGDLEIKVVAEIVQDGCTARVTRSLIDSDDNIFTKDDESRSTETNITIKLPVPLGISAGPARYRARVQWSCNFVQAWFPKTVLQPELDFEVVPLKDQLQIPEQQGIYQQPDLKIEFATMEGTK